METQIPIVATTPWWLVVLLGMGIVFIGLGLMVLLCNALKLLFSRVKEEPVLAPVLPMAPVAVEDRKRLMAIAAAVIAEEEGSNAVGFQIVSFKRRTQA